MRPEAPRIVRTSIVLSSGAATPNELAITPDGAHIVYTRNNQSQLVVRALDELESKATHRRRQHQRTFGIARQSIGRVHRWRHADENGLVRGAAVPITPVDAPARGTAWLPDDTIVFATANGTTGLQRVAAIGGNVTVLTKPDPKLGEADHIAPMPLPGGRAVLFTIISRTGELPQIAVMDLQTGDRKILLRGSHARYLASGHLVFAADGILQAVPFDLDTRTITGTQVPVLQNFAMLGGVVTVIDVAANGTLVYARSNGNIAPPRVGRSRGPRDRNQGPHRHVPDAAALA